MKNINELNKSNWFQVWNVIFKDKIKNLRSISYNPVNGLVYACLKNEDMQYELDIPSSIYLNNGVYISGNRFMIDWKTETVILGTCKEIDWIDIDFEKTFGISIGYFDCWKSAWEWIIEFICKSELPKTVCDGCLCEVKGNALAKNWMFKNMHFSGNKFFPFLPCRINLIQKRFDMSLPELKIGDHIDFSSLLWYESFKFIPIICPTVTPHEILSHEISKSEITTGRAYHWDADSDFNLYLENIKGGYEVHVKSLYTPGAENFELPDSDKYILECELDDLEHMEYDRLWAYLWWLCNKYEGWNQS